ncbi:MAG: TolB family protein, partial [Acidimicrobiales bacterium]
MSSRANRPRRLARTLLVAASLVAPLLAGAPAAEAALATTLVSVSSTGSQAGGGFLSTQPATSADGRFVAFTSSAVNLVANDGNNVTDVFLRDRTAGTTRRVSVSSAGVEANAGSSQPSISADGRFIAFSSGASNLVTGDTNGQTDVFVHNRETGETTRVSVVTGGGQGCAPVAPATTCSGNTGPGAVTGGASQSPSISGDGRFVAFQSAASFLATGVPAGDTNGAVDIFVHDRQTTTTSRVSVVTGGGQGCAGSPCTGAGASTLPSISRDGRVVSFTSAATYLASGVPAGDTNGVLDIFAHDRQTTTTARVSIVTGGGQATGASNPSSISGDGRFVAFTSESNNLVAGDTNG